MKQVMDASPPASPHPPAPRLTGPEKAAVLLAALGEEQSARLLKQLSQEEIQVVSHAMAAMPVVGAPQIQEVLLECEGAVADAQFPIRGGVEFAKHLLTSTFGSDTAGRILERLPGQAIRETAHFKSIQRAEPRQLAKILESEHPQTVAIILSRLSTPHAAGLLSELPPALRADVALRMASLEHISPDVTQKIVAIIGKKLTTFGQLKRESFGGVRAVADVLNQIDAVACKDILEVIDEQEPAMADAIRHLMFVFDDLMLVDANGMKELVGRLARRAGVELELDEAVAAGKGLARSGVAVSVEVRLAVALVGDVVDLITDDDLLEAVALVAGEHDDEVQE